jgi:hypothetical protein
MKCVALALIVLCAPQAQGKKKDWLPGQGIDWKGDWDAAVEEAAARNVPIHLAALMDNCPNCKAMSDSAFTDPRIIELSRSFVNVLAHNETTHGDHDAVVGKEKVKLCNEYATVPCSLHRQGWSAVGKFINGTFIAPMTLFADPAGKEIGKAEGGLSANDLLKKMNDMLTKVPGDKITSSQWQAARRLVSDSDAWLAKGEPKRAAECLVKLLKMKGAPIKSIAGEAAERANEAGRRALQAALALGADEEKKKALRKVVDDYRPLEVSAEAKKELEAIK